jgi:hypothetical protein
MDVRKTITAAFVGQSLRNTRHLSVVVGVLLLAGCGDHDTGGGGGQGSAPLSKTGPSLDETTPITAAPTVTVTGKALKPDSSIRIEGGTDTIDLPLQKGKKFSATVPLKLNSANHLLVTELFSSGGSSPGVLLTVIQDSQPPKVFIDFPQPGEVLSDGTTTVAGRVSDVLAGFMGLEVSVNGQPADVDAGIGTNGSFTISEVFLSEGVPTTVTAVATDAVGNTATQSIDVMYAPPVGQSLASLSGDGQSAAIGELLPLPILVEVSHADGSPFVGKVVTFDVIKSNGRVTADGVGDGTLMLTVMTDRQGIAQAYWRLGADAGCGNNRVAVSSNDIAGKVYFCASAHPGPPKQINVGSGGNQIAQVTGPAPEPLRVWVSDGCNGVAGMPVTFTVTKGAGTLTGGGKFNKSVVTVMTGITGHAETLLTVGGTAGNTEVRANYPDSGVADAVFTVLGLATEQEVTTFVGQVFDNATVPIGGVTCTLEVGADPPISVVTDENGSFLIDGIFSSGLAGLLIDGATATTLGGIPINPQELRFPSLHYEPVVIAHARNVLRRPVLLPALDPTNDREYDGSMDVELTVAGMEGLRMIIEAGSLTMPDGTHPTPEDPLAEPLIVALNQVHHDDVPMPMPDGVSSPFAWTLQPSGATFDPPVKIIYPNMTGLPAGAASYFLSFNHDTGRFEIVASGSVSDDGSVIETDEGSGITVAGWGCNCPPYAVAGECESDCDDCPSGLVSKGTCQKCPESLSFPQPMSALALEMENGKTVITSGIPDPGIQAAMNATLTAFASFKQALLAADPTAKAPITSAYRPTDYQAHLFGIKQAHDKWEKLEKESPECLAACAMEIQKIMTECNKHWKKKPSCANEVNPPGESTHEKGKAVDSALTTKLSEAQFKALAQAAGLSIFPEATAYHFTHVGNVSAASVDSGDVDPGDVLQGADEPETEGFPGLPEPLWNLTVEGQTIFSAFPDLFLVSNIPSPDAYGVGGPGTPPDFVGDNFVRVTGVSNTGIEPLFAFSAPFHIVAGQPQAVGDMVITSVPPPLPQKISLSLDSVILLAGHTTQAHTVGVLGDGTVADVTLQANWTLYSSSNQGVVKVGPDGEVTGIGPGTAFITSTNEGATSVAKIVVTTADDPLTTIVGFVQLENGTPVENATISVVGLPQETTSLADGSYMLVDMPTVGIPEYTIRAVAEIGGEFFLGTEAALMPVPGGLTDAGVIVLGETGGFGPVILSGMDPEDHGSGFGQQGWQMIQDILRFVVEESVIDASPDSVLQLGGSVGNLAITQSAAGPLGFTVTHATGADISTVDFLQYDALYMPTSENDVGGGLSQADLNLINQREQDIIDFINAGGGLAAFAQNLVNGYAWFPLDGLTTASPTGNTIVLTPEGSFILSPSATSVVPFHTAFTGPAGFFGLDVLATEGDGQMLPLIIGGIVVLPTQ